MLIEIINPQFQTAIFFLIFFVVLLLSVKYVRLESFFSIDVTNQIKGFAILAIVFSHIGYSLSHDDFLYPLSVLGGVGVNLFLFLSGFGLTLSEIKNPLSPIQFYKKRLLRLFLPLWITISILLAADFFILHRVYTLTEVIKSYLGFFPRNDLFINLDSPLWYFTAIFFYYLIYPLVYIKKFPYFTPIFIVAITYILFNFSLPVSEDTVKIYKLHTLAFPIGILLALIINKIKLNLPNIFKLCLFILAFLIFLYTSIYSGVGDDPKIEQSISLITALSIITVFSLSKLRFTLFSVFGLVSYEIYLIHWPILSRYGYFYDITPPYLATLLEIVLIFVLAFILQKITSLIKL